MFFYRKMIRIGELYNVENLSNDLIIEAYNKAIELKLDDDFQLMLKKEILRRKLELNNLSKISEF